MVMHGAENVNMHSFCVPGKTFLNCLSLLFLTGVEWARFVGAVGWIFGGPLVARCLAYDVRVSTFRNRICAGH